MPHPPLKIVVESHIPYLRGVLEKGYGASVTYLGPSEITPVTVADADAVIVRTRTRCDAALLQDSKVQFIGTATIGTDHIDLDWCADRGIAVANAPGCNAPAVAQYVFATLLAIINRPLRNHTLGIVGVGNVGKIVEHWARHMDIPVMLCDPPRQAAEGGTQWCTMEDIAHHADIITVHTPLDASTHHLLDSRYLSTLRRAPIIINAARGPVADNAALAQARRSGQISGAIIDCWENEPNILPELLEVADIATPHIAGYSAEGKVRATQAVLDALADHFALPRLTADAPAPLPCADSVTPAAVAQSFDPVPLSDELKAKPGTFENMRNTYTLRHETPPAIND